MGKAKYGKLDVCGARIDGHSLLPNQLYAQLARLSSRFGDYSKWGNARGNMSCRGEWGNPPFLAESEQDHPLNGCGLISAQTQKQTRISGRGDINGIV